MGAASKPNTWRNLIFHGGLIAFVTLFLTLILTIYLSLNGLTPYLVFGTLLILLVISSHIWRELIVNDTRPEEQQQIHRVLINDRREITKRIIAAWIAAGILAMIVAFLLQGVDNLVQTNGIMGCSEADSDVEDATSFSELSSGQQSAVKAAIEENGADPPTGFTDHETIIYQNTTYICTVDRA